MEYLGYRAAIEFDGKSFFGVIENISDLVRRCVHRCFSKVWM